MQEQVWKLIYEEEQENLRRRQLEEEERRKREKQEPAQESQRQAAVSAVSGKKSELPVLLQSLEVGKILEKQGNIDAKRVKRNDPHYGEDEERRLAEELHFYREGLPDTSRTYKNAIERYTSKDFYKSLLVSLPLMDDPMAVQLATGAGGRALVHLAPIPFIGWAAAGLGILAQVGGVVAATHMEAKDEAAGSYREAYDKAMREGKGIEEAHQIGTEAYKKGYWGNIAVIGAHNVVQQALMFASFGGAVLPQTMMKMRKAEKAIKMAEKSLARAEKAAAKAEKLQSAGKLERAAHTAGKIGKEGARLVGTGITESIEERLQTGVGQWATGEEVDLLGHEATEAGWAGFTMGIGLGGAGRALSAATDRLMNSGKEDDSDPHGTLRAAALVNRLKGVELDPTRAHVELGISGNDLDEQGFAVGDTSDSKFPRVSEVDPVLEMNHFQKIMENLTPERKTILNNKVTVNREAGMEQSEALYKALDDMMQQDGDFRDMAYKTYVESLGEYQTNAEEMFNRFAVYGAVLNKVSPETKELLQSLIIDEIKESGDVDGSLSYDGVMAAFLDTPEGAAVLNDIGLQDGSFWRQRSEELLIKQASMLNSAPFSDRVQYFEGVLANQEANGADIAPELLYQMYQDDLTGGVDLIDALYDSGKVDRDTLNRVAQGYLARAQQEQPQVFEGPSAQEQ